MPAAAADDADFGGDLLETVQETQNDEEEQALTGSQVRSWPDQRCDLTCRFGVAKFGLQCNRWLADNSCRSPLS